MADRPPSRTLRLHIVYIMHIYYHNMYIDAFFFLGSLFAARRVAIEHLPGRGRRPNLAGRLLDTPRPLPGLQEGSYRRLRRARRA